MTTRTGDAYYDQTKQLWDTLTIQQKANIAQRIRSVKAIINPRIFIFSLNAAIQLELDNPSPPAPCPPINDQEASFAVFLKSICPAVNIMAGYPPNYF